MYNTKEKYPINVDNFEPYENDFLKVKIFYDDFLNSGMTKSLNDVVERIIGSCTGIRDLVLSLTIMAIVANYALKQTDKDNFFYLYQVLHRYS